MKKIILILVVFLLNSYNMIYAQIALFPQAVFLSPQSRASNLKILNMSQEVKEIQIDLQFGYSKYDSLGNNTIIYGDTLPEAVWSAIPYVKVFPKKLLLQPNGEQVVKLMLNNISDKPDGTYFGRIIVLSKNPPQEIDTTYKPDKIEAKIEVQFSFIAALIVEKGKINCEIKVNPFSYNIDSANVNIMVPIEKGGNSPFLGTSEMSIFDGTGKLVAESKELTPYYFSSQRAFKFKKGLFTNGKYKVDLTMTNEHKDIPKEFKIPFFPIKQTYEIYIDGLN